MAYTPCRRFDFVVVANRLSVKREERDDRGWVRSPGGLVTALEPVLRAEKGAWVGWSGVPDRDFASFDHDGYRLVPVRISAQQLEEYYEGFSNDTLWPLHHDGIVEPTFDRQWWSTYVQVNEQFAEAASQAAAVGASVWVQDYQLQLVPQMLRRSRPDLTIGFFLHVPFPPSEIFRQLPWWHSVIDGMLGADLVGFQTSGDLENFCAVAESLTEAVTVPLGEDVRQVVVDGRVVQTGAFPIAADTPALTRLARSASVRERAREIRRDLGDPESILLGVDRVDYTKGIEQRLDAVGELYDEGRLEPGRHVTVQIATPSRERLPRYALMRNEIETRVGHINGAHGAVGGAVVHYIHRPVDREELAALFVAADLLTVTALRDGMNLVAKEYAACHPEGDGALVLSTFAGAAAELWEAYTVNPYDAQLMKDTIVAALEADPHERRRRMLAMHSQVRERDVHEWARSFLDALHACPPVPGDRNAAAAQSIRAPYVQIDHWPGGVVASRTAVTGPESWPH